MLHRQLCRLLLNAQILRARGLSGHTSPHGRHQLRQCSDLAAYSGHSSVLGPCRLRQGLLGARTSPPTPGTPRCSDITAYVGGSLVLGRRRLHRGLLGARSSPATQGTPRSLVLYHRQRRRGLLAPRCSDITSDAGDFSLLGAWISPATSGTPRSSALGHRQIRWGLLSARTSQPTPGTPRCSVIASDAGDSSLLSARISLAAPRTPQCSVIASDARDSSLLGARSSPATPGTPRSSVLDHRQLRRELRRWSDIAGYAGDSSVLGSCYVSSVCYQAAPCCSDQGADLVQRVWGLDTGMSDDVDKLSDLFFFDPATRFILHLPAGSGTKWAHFTLR